MSGEATTVAAPAYRAVAARLRAEGFARFSGLMGEDTAGLTTALVEHGARYVAARHETTAVAIADGYARATGAIGLCVVSRGPGLLNALAAAAGADRAGTPLVLIAGDAPRGSHAAADLKAMDQAAAAAAAGLACVRPATTSELPAALDDALALAATGRTVLLSLPLDVLEDVAAPSHAAASPGAAGPSPAAASPGAAGPSPAAASPGAAGPSPAAASPGAAGPSPAAASPGAAGPLPAPAAPVAPDAGALDAAAARLGAARRPLLLAGAGAHRSGAAPALRRLAARLPCLLGTTLAAKDLFAGHPDDLGIVGGFSDAAARAQLEQVDLVVAFGAGLNRFTTAALPAVDVVQVDHDPSRIGLLHPVALGVHGDAGLAAQALAARLVAGDAPRPWREALARRATRYEDRSTATTVDPRTLLRALDERLPAERNVAVDCGHFVGYPAQHLRVSGPERFFWSLHFGTLGTGLGLGLGVALAREHEPTVAVIGDGGLLMALGELETLARTRAPLTLVILDDGAYAAEKHFLELHGEAGGLAVFGRETDFAGIARRLGLEAITVRSTADLDGLRAGPFVLDCKVPLVRAGWYEEMITGRYSER